MRKTFLKQLGIKIGHFTRKNDLTGVTVFLIEKGANIGIDIRGSATGSHNTHAYGDMISSLELVQAVVFAGGSSFGMESFFGVMQFLYDEGIGNRFGTEIIPGVTGAVIYDRFVGYASYPTKMNGYQAAKQASYVEYRMGNIGVGTGATIGKWEKGIHMKGGFGMATVGMQRDIIVAAFVVTNAYGDVVNPGTKQWYTDVGHYMYGEKTFFIPESAQTNTTLALVATNTDLKRPTLSKIASRCHDAFARAIFPIHTLADGDIVFAISTKENNRKHNRKRTKASIDQISLIAEQVVIEAIKASIVNATGIAGFPSYHEIMSE